jgi:PAS domain-containing protein
MPGDRFLELASAEDRRVLDALFRHAREGVTIQGRRGLVYANDRAAKLMGLPGGREMMSADLAAILSQTEMIDEEGNPFPLELLPGRRVLAAEETSKVTIGYRLPGSREVRWSRLGSKVAFTAQVEPGIPGSRRALVPV